MTTDLAPALTPSERTALTHAEAAIEQGATQVAEALTEIRDKRLYKEDYATFEAYCRERWGMTHRRANQQIAAAEVNEIVGTIGSQLSERGARELADLRDDPDRLRDAYKKAHEQTGGNVTARAIREARQRVDDSRRLTRAEAEQHAEKLRAILHDTRQHLTTVAAELLAAGCTKGEVVMALTRHRRTVTAKEPHDDAAWMAQVTVDPVIDEVMEWHVDPPPKVMPAAERERLLNYVVTGLQDDG